MLLKGNSNIYIRRLTLTAHEGTCYPSNENYFPLPLSPCLHLELVSFTNSQIATGLIVYFPVLATLPFSHIVMYTHATFSTIFSCAPPSKTVTLLGQNET